MRGTVWTDEMIATLAGMKRAGLSAKIIAARLGVTEAAVALKCNRIGAHCRLDGKPFKLRNYNPSVSIR
jgi:hypothetical protein